MKKILAIILCITFLFSTVACGSEDPNDMETFDFTKKDFKRNLNTLLRPSSDINVTETDISPDTYDLRAKDKDGDLTYISLTCNDSDFPVKVSIWCAPDKYTNSFLFVVKYALIIINADADPQTIMNQLEINSDFKDNPMHSCEEITFEGVCYSLEDGVFIAKIDPEHPDDYVKHPISDYTDQYPGTYAKNSPEDSSEKSSEIDSEISAEQPVQPDTEVEPSSETEVSSEDDYQELLSKYDALFSEQLSVIDDSKALVESALNGSEVESSQLLDALSAVNAAEDVLQGYSDSFYENRPAAPFGTKIMTLLSDAQSALRRYAITIEHLYDYSFYSEKDSADLEHADEYYQKTNDALSDYSTLLESEQNK